MHPQVYIFIIIIILIMVKYVFFLVLRCQIRNHISQISNKNDPYTLEMIGKHPPILNGFKFVMSCTTKKIHISCQFCFEIFFVGNTYKFCYEKKIARNCYQFSCKIFCIKHFSQQIL